MIFQQNDANRSNKNQTHREEIKAVTDRGSLSPRAPRNISDYRQVFWLSDHSTNRTFSATKILYIMDKIIRITNGLRGVRPRLQRRVRGGFSPPSLQACKYRRRQSRSIYLSKGGWISPTDESVISRIPRMSQEINSFFEWRFGW